MNSQTKYQTKYLMKSRMKSYLYHLVTGLAFTLVSSVAVAGVSDESFIQQFSSYRAKNQISPLRTAQALAATMKLKPLQVLNRYVSAKWIAKGKFGGLSSQQWAVIDGVDSYIEMGLSHEEALSKVSDLTGQMTETLESIYSAAKVTYGKRDFASNKRKKIAAR